MLNAVKDALRPLKAAGKSPEEAIAEKPLADLEAQWGGRLFTTERCIGIIWD